MANPRNPNPLLPENPIQTKTPIASPENRPKPTKPLLIEPRLTNVTP